MILKLAFLKLYASYASSIQIQALNRNANIKIIIAKYITIWKYFL